MVLPLMVGHLPMTGEFVHRQIWIFEESQG